MKLLLTILLALTALLAPTTFAQEEAPPVRRALPVVPDDYTISESAARATILHMAQLAKDQQERLNASDAINDHLVESLDAQAVKHAAALKAIRANRPLAADVIGQVAQLDHDLASEKFGRLKDRLVGFPLAVLLGIILGVIFCLLAKAGLLGAGLAARIGLKTTTGI